MINALPYQFGIAAKAKSSMPDAGRSRLNFLLINLAVELTRQ